MEESLNPAFLESSHCMGVRSPSRPFSLGQPVTPMGSFTSSLRGGRGGDHAELFAVVHESCCSRGEEHGREDSRNGLIVDAVAVALPTAAVVVIVKDEERLRVVELGLGGR